MLPHVWQVSESGKYRIKLYDGRKLRWQIMEIDDYLPCTAWGGLKPELLFGKISEGKLCMALLEKAFAKLYGSYSALSAGFQPVAWCHLTGCKEFFRYKSSYTVAVRWVVLAGDGIAVYSETCWHCLFKTSSGLLSYCKFLALSYDSL